ncbi:MAG TPA: hypothetical protein VMU42_13355 [Candidatus Sulfotelmatobacter sp.]|nr:hypothetical protein [Candidatus Sulfotelmatobacter sp.]
MPTDRYGLALSTASLDARDDYVRGCDLLFTTYPGAIAAFDHAIAADPGFALAHVARAQALLIAGDVAAARNSMAAADAVAAGLPAREASHAAFFNLLVAGQAAAALVAARAHLQEWPRDAMVLNTTATPNGLIGLSGKVGQKREQVALMESLAPQYGDDWWFAAHYGMALVEGGQRDAGRRHIERSLAANPRNAYGAHAQAHLCYEDGDAGAGCAFLASWLQTYPRQGHFHGHLSWHRALGELEIGNADVAFRIFAESCAPEVHSGSARMKITDGISFLWRWELAGNPHDPARWGVLHDFVAATSAHPGMALADMHAVLADAVAGDGAALEARLRELAALEQADRYPSGDVIPALSQAFRAFQRGDFTAAIAAIEPVMDQRERIGGSRAQTDLVEFTLLRAYVEAGRMDEVRHLLAARRTGHPAVPVAGASLH